MTTTSRPRSPFAGLLSRRQLQSIAWSDNRKIALWTGAVSSGKTTASLIALLDAIRLAPRSGLIVFTGNTLQTIERNILTPLQSPELFGVITRHVHHTEGSNTAMVMGRKVHLVGANDIRAERRIRGSTICLAYVDEATLLPQSYWMMLLSRLRTPGARLLATTNPDAPRHWLRRDFIVRAAEVNMRVFEFRLEDNPSLSEEYKRDLHAQYVGLWYTRFILGKWVVASGAIYDMFDPKRHIVTTLPRIAFLPGAGVDYGTRHPFHALMLGFTKDRGLCLTREWRYDPAAETRSMTDAEYSRKLRTWIGQDRPRWVAVDPAAASFKVQLFHDGVPNVTDADNTVLDGLRLVSSLMATHRLSIHESCTGLLDEIPAYSWDDQAAERGLDQPVKSGDDGCDAMRYVIKTTEQLWRPDIREPALV